MKMCRLLGVTLCLIPVLSLAADTEAKLGATFKRVWFKGASISLKRFAGVSFSQSHPIPTAATPLVGIEVDLGTFRDALSDALADQLKAFNEKLSRMAPGDKARVEAEKASLKFPAAIAGLSGAVKKLNTPKADKEGYWQIQSKSLIVDDSDLENPKYESAPIGYEHLDDSLVVIADARGSYNDSYTLKFEAGRFFTKLLGFDIDKFLAPDALVLTQGDITFSNRTSLSVSTDFAKKSATLLSGEVVDGKFQNDTKDATQVAFKVGYDGFPNPLQNFVFREHSYYRLSLEGTLSDQQFDTKSRIELRLEGVTDFLHRRSGYVTFAGFRVLTSQSQRQTTALYELGARKGDKRGHGDRFIAADDVLETVYGELALQLGYSRYKLFDNVPDPDKKDLFILRPRFTLGVKDLFKSKSSLFKVSGHLDTYYLLKNYGGGDPMGAGTTATGFRQVFGLTFTVGNENQNIAFSVEGGTNPAQGFTRITPSYSLGAVFKF